MATVRKAIGLGGWHWLVRYITHLCFCLFFMFIFSIVLISLYCRKANAKRGACTIQNTDNILFELDC